MPFRIGSKLLAQHNIIKLTEAGGISTESQHRVVAIERNPTAVLELQKQLPGLKILQQNFKDIISGDSLTRFPTGQQEDYCCSKIINLDFQDSLQAINTNGVTTFPMFDWLNKVAQIHATKKPKLDWCLCLTLNGSIAQSALLSPIFKEFLLENFRSVPEFETSCRNLLGDTLHDKITHNSPLDLGSLTSEEQQKILMVFVPKKIARGVHHQNWQVRTRWNLRYGGNANQAPMVTWVLSFVWDSRATSTPEAVYKDSLREILASAGHIEDDGRITSSAL